MSREEIERNVSNVVASVEMEGLKVPEELKVLMGKVISEEITADEAINSIMLEFRESLV
jgi:hypothetical protein